MRRKPWKSWAPRTSPPTFITRVAWVFIVLAGIATVGLLWQSAASLARERWHQMGNPATELRSVLNRGDLFDLLYYISKYSPLCYWAYLPVSATALVAAIGLLKRKSWARKLFIAVLAIGIASCAALSGLQLPALGVFQRTFPRGATGVRFICLSAYVAALAISAASGIALGLIVRKLTLPRYRREFRARRAGPAPRARAGDKAR